VSALIGPGAPGVKGLAAALLAIVAMLAAPAPSAESAQPPEVPAEASIVVDARSGKVIAADDPDARRQIASATKLMTALITSERESPRQVFPAADYDPIPVESQIGLTEGERLTVRDLLVALLLESANDAAATLAQGISGSSEAFVDDMNERAQELGLEDTSYANPIGFDDPDNHSTARDLAELGRAVLAEERLADIVEEPALALRSGSRHRVVENRNDLVGVAPSVDGLKTGQTGQAGHVLVGSASRGPDRQVITVVLGAPSEAARDQATRTLLDYGLDQFRERRVVREGRPVAEAALAHDQDAQVELAPASDASVTTLRGQELETRVDAPPELGGPLPAGHPVGTVEVVSDGKVTDRVPLVTATAVPPPSLLDRAGTTLGVVIALVVAIACALALARVGRTRRPGQPVA
jgi:D-alanyl-D-alanine carboxypeptidase (penicillin-binding protein 5/6)